VISSSQHPESDIDFRFRRVGRSGGMRSARKLFDGLAYPRA
jgi:hypothetical protein